VFDPESALGTIAIDHLRRAGSVGDRHIGIGPQEIKRVPREARRLVLRRPVEYLQIDMVIGAPSRELGLRSAIGMDLPN